MGKVLNYPGITTAVWDKENKGKGQKGSEKTWNRLWDKWQSEIWDRPGCGGSAGLYEFAVIILNLHLWANRRKILVQVNANAISTQIKIK